MTTAAATYRVGDKVEITETQDPNFGRVLDVLEISDDDKAIRTEKGWFLFAQVDPAKKEVQTIVDGKPASVVLNGSTGAVQEPLIEMPLDRLCYELACISADLKIAKSAAGRARQVVKDLGEKYGKKAAELEARGIKSHGEPPQMELAESVSGEADAFDNEEDNAE